PGFFTLPPEAQGAILGQVAAGLQPLVGQRLIMVSSEAGSIGKQWSNEVQVNYTSERLHATAGALYFHSDDEAGGPIGMQNTLAFPSFIPPSGVIPLGNEARSFNKATSIAAYAQLEFKIPPELEVVAGGRVTRDKKTSRFR